MTPETDFREKETSATASRGFTGGASVWQANAPLATPGASFGNQMHPEQPAKSCTFRLPTPENAIPPEIAPRSLVDSLCCPMPPAQQKHPVHPVAQGRRQNPYEFRKLCTARVGIFGSKIPMNSRSFALRGRESFDLSRFGLGRMNP